MLSGDAFASTVLSFNSSLLRIIFPFWLISSYVFSDGANIGLSNFDLDFPILISVDSSPEFSSFSETTSKLSKFSTSSMNYRFFELILKTLDSPFSICSSICS